MFDSMLRIAGLHIHDLLKSLVASNVSSCQAMLVERSLPHYYRFEKYTGPRIQKKQGLYRIRVEKIQAKVVSKPLKILCKLRLKL